MHLVGFIIIILSSDRRRYTVDRNDVLKQTLRSQFAIRPKHLQLAASDLACSEPTHALTVKLPK